MATSPVPWITRYPFSETVVGAVGVVVLAEGRVVVDEIVVTLGSVVVEVSAAAATVVGGVGASVLRLQMMKATTPVRAPPIKTMRSFRDLGTCDQRLRASRPLSALSAS
jgi:hypothetical protein